MINAGHFVEILSLLGQSSAHERWRSVRSAPEYDYPMTLILLAGVAVGIIVLISLSVYMWKYLMRTVFFEADFRRTAGKEGLGEEECNLLFELAKQADLSGNYKAIFTSETDFRNGSQNYLTSEEFCNLPNERRMEINVRISQLRRKLGMQSSSNEDDPLGSRQIAANTRIKVLPPDKPEEFLAIVLQADNDKISIAPLAGADPKPGESWRIRHFDGRALWEFDAPVVAIDKGRVILAHDEEGRMINQRRFVRVSVHFPAKICTYDFLHSEKEVAPPQWSDAQLIQLAGPGLKLRSNLAVHPGDRVLVVTGIRDGEVVYAVAKIRRVDNPDRTMKDLVAECVGITQAEISKLASATNFAATQQEHLRRVKEKENPPKRRLNIAALAADKKWKEQAGATTSKKSEAK
ncbi:MAG: hypothetical protein K8S55_04375 [Phycisphaerae bacterium]|nr:hypothetical protein [Phycisphaerae bacterium]